MPKVKNQLFYVLEKDDANSLAAQHLRNVAFRRRQANATNSLAVFFLLYELERSISLEEFPSSVLAPLSHYIIIYGESFFVSELLTSEFRFAM